MAKTPKIRCIIFDLGLSSLQISNLKEAFPLTQIELLDMRMGLNKNRCRKNFK